MARITIICFLLLVSLSCYSQNKDTFEVYFPFNKSQLTREAENYIDALIFKDTLIHGDRLIVLGYADYVGSTGYNDSLSRLRAKNVCNYLINSGFEKTDIKLMMGRGKVERNGLTSKDGYATDRKVQIIIDHSPQLTIIAPPKPTVLKQPAVMPQERIDITKLKVNEAFALNNIIFQPGLPVLERESEPDLARLYDFLVQNASVRIRIEGHVCCMGPNPGNEIHDDGKLSELRAASVYTYLAEKGINRNRLQCVGLGNKNPVEANEDTEEARVKNRRVEIRILSK